MSLNKKDLISSLRWILLSAVLILISQICLADDIYTIVVKKQEQKEKHRWSLSEWFDTRDRMRIQDLWLAIHSPSPYEFFIEGNYQINQAVPGSSFNAWELSFGAFATIFGLEAKYDSGLDQHAYGIFDLRVFGYHDQGTNLTLQAGLRNTNSSMGFSYRNAIAGAKITIYLARPFGLEGLYHHYFSSTSNSSGVSFGGDQFQGGAFLEFKFLRIYGDYFSNPETLTTTSGVLVGTKVYF